MPQEDKDSNSKVQPPGNDQWLSRRDNSKKSGKYGKPSPREQSRENAVAAWVGEERRADVFAALRPEPRSMKNLVDSLLSSIDVEDIILLEQLKKAWPTLAGEVNARQCCPRSIEKDVLAVEVFSPAWMYILKAQQENIIAQRVSKFTGGKVNRITFVPQGTRKQYVIKN